MSTSEPAIIPCTIFFCSISYDSVIGANTGMPPHIFVSSDSPPNSDSDLQSFQISRDAERPDTVMHIHLWRAGKEDNLIIFPFRPELRKLLIAVILNLLGYGSCGRTNHKIPYIFLKCLTKSLIPKTEAKVGHTLRYSRPYIVRWEQNRTMEDANLDPAIAVLVYLVCPLF